MLKHDTLQWDLETMQNTQPLPTEADEANGVSVSGAVGGVQLLNQGGWVYVTFENDTCLVVHAYDAYEKRVSICRLCACTHACV